MSQKYCSILKKKKTSDQSLELTTDLTFLKKTEVNSTGHLTYSIYQIIFKNMLLESAEIYSATHSQDTIIIFPKQNSQYNSIFK